MIKERERERERAKKRLRKKITSGPGVGVWGERKGGMYGKGDVRNTGELKGVVGIVGSAFSGRKLLQTRAPHDP